MGFYSTKITDYGDKQKVSIYSKRIAYGDDSAKPVNREKYSNMNEEKQAESAERRIRYYKKKVAELTDIALMNPDLFTIITLTFKEKSIIFYENALAEWQCFLKRLRYYCKKPLKYICVWEYQKQRSQNEGITDGGVFHFHCLMNTGFIEHEKLSKIWGNGFVWIDSLKSERQREKAIRYTLKYITKEITENAKTRGKRFIFTSNNLEKPSVSYLEEKLVKDDIIFENLEEMIRDGEYEIKNSRGTINHVEYVEYKK